MLANPPRSIFLWIQFISCNWCDLRCLTVADDDNITKAACAETECPPEGKPFIFGEDGNKWCPVVNGFLLGGICFAGMTYMFINMIILGLWSGCSGYVKEFQNMAIDEMLGYSEHVEMKETVEGKKGDEEAGGMAANAQKHDQAVDAACAHDDRPMTDFEWIRVVIIATFYVLFWITQWGCKMPGDESYNVFAGWDARDDDGLHFCNLVNEMFFEGVGKAAVAYTLVSWFFKFSYALYNRKVQHTLFAKGGFFDDLVGWSEMNEIDEKIGVHISPNATRRA